MSKLEERLNEAEKEYEASLREDLRNMTGVQRREWEQKNHRLYAEREKYKMYLSDAKRLAEGYEVALVIYGRFDTWVKVAEDTWELIYEHALKIINEIKEDK